MGISYREYITGVLHLTRATQSLPHPLLRLCRQPLAPKPKAFITYRALAVFAGFDIMGHKRRWYRTQADVTSARADPLRGFMPQGAVCLCKTPLLLTLGSLFDMRHAALSNSNPACYHDLHTGCALAFTRWGGVGGLYHRNTILPDCSSAFVYSRSKSTPPRTS